MAKRSIIFVRILGFTLSKWEVIGGALNTERHDWTSVFIRSTLAFVLRIDWAGDGERARRKAEKPGGYSNDQVRDRIQFKMPVAHPRGVTRPICRKTRLALSYNIGTGERTLSSQHSHDS